MVIRPRRFCPIAAALKPKRHNDLRVDGDLYMRSVSAKPPTHQRCSHRMRSLDSQRCHDAPVRIGVSDEERCSNSQARTTAGGCETTAETASAATCGGQPIVEVAGAVAPPPGGAPPDSRLASQTNANAPRNNRGALAFVEVAGIEPASIGADSGLLRAQPRYRGLDRRASCGTARSPGPATV